MSITWQSIGSLNFTVLGGNGLPRSDNNKKKYLVLSKEDKNRKLERIKLTVNELGYFLMQNDFPYDFTDDIIHYVFWYKNYITMQQAQEIINTLIHVGLENIIVCENNADIKSVHDIEHYQVFCRKT